MKIEVGKYYKNRAGEVLGPISYVDHPTFMFHAGGKSYTAGGMFYNDGDTSPFDLVEECNADRSPIVPEPPSGLSWNVPADRSWRDEIALRVLPGLISLGGDLEDADLPNGTPGEIAVKQAFYIADVFLKAAKQS